MAGGRFRWILIASAACILFVLLRFISSPYHAPARSGTIVQSYDDVNEPQSPGRRPFATGPQVESCSCPEPPSTSTPPAPSIAPVPASTITPSRHEPDTPSSSSPSEPRTSEAGPPLFPWTASARWPQIDTPPDTGAYSSFHCMGGNDRVEGTERRTCVLNNVCTVAGEERVLVFRDPNKVPMPTLFDNNAMDTEFPDVFLFRGAYDFLKAWTLTSVDAPFPLSSVPEPSSPSESSESSRASASKAAPPAAPPLGAFGAAPAPQPESVSVKQPGLVGLEHLRSDDEGGHKPKQFVMHDASVAVAFQFVLEENFGHFVGDCMHPVYLMQAILGMQPTPDVQILVLGKEPIFQRFRDGLLRGVSKRKPIPMREAGNTCFRKLIVGAGSFNFQDIGARTNYAALTWEPFRDYVLHNLGFPVPGPVLRRHKVLVMLKSARSLNSGRHFRNHDDMMAYLRRALWDVEFVELSPGEAKDVTLHDQIELVQSVTGYISPPGGVSFLGHFLQPYALAIISDVQYDGKSGRFVYDDNVWTHYPNLISFHYPICTVNEQTCPDNIRCDLIISPKRMVYLLSLGLRAVEQRHHELVRSKAVAQQTRDARQPICDIHGGTVNDLPAPPARNTAAGAAAVR